MRRVVSRNKKATLRWLFAFSNDAQVIIKQFFCIYLLLTKALEFAAINAPYGTKQAYHRYPNHRGTATGCS
jgi:hypothetical protein